MAPRVFEEEEENHENFGKALLDVVFVTLRRTSLSIKLRKLTTFLSLSTMLKVFFTAEILQIKNNNKKY